MSTPFTDPTLEALHRRNQLALIDFLNTDLDVAFTYLTIAHSAKSRDDATPLLSKARTAIETVRGFLPRVDDPRASADIRSQADRLDAELADYLATHGEPSQA